MEEMNLLLGPVREFFAQLGALLPKLLLAIVILIAGWLLAKALKLAAVKGLRAINFNVLAERAGLDGFLRQGGIEANTTGILGWLLYWLVIFAALMVAFNSLGLAHVTELVGRVAMFIPKVIVAVLVLALGAYFARFIDTAIAAYGKNVGLGDARILGRLARYAIMAFVVLVALEEVNVATDLVHQGFLIILAGVVLALALAFGLGGRHWAEDMLERWWPKRRPDSGKEGD